MMTAKTGKKNKRGIGILLILLLCSVLLQPVQGADCSLSMSAEHMHVGHDEMAATQHAQHADDQHSAAAASPGSAHSSSCAMQVCCWAPVTAAVNPHLISVPQVFFESISICNNEIVVALLQNSLFRPPRL
jgi:hypothetical protein